MEEKTSGIVVSSIVYGESDKIINVFTPDKGVVSAKMKSVKKAGAKLKFASEPFCFAEFVFSLGKVGRTVIGASLIDSFYPVRLDLKKLYSASAILTFVKKFCRENINCSDVFLLTVNALKKIAYGTSQELSSLAEFLISALALCGYAIDVNACHCCGGKITEKVYFDYRTGGFYCEECFDGQGREILKETYFALFSALNNEKTDDESMIKGLKLLDYYMQNRVDENNEPLKELIKLYT
ncbi:MAG: DNA repair protein RecO [Clostridia bacterium]|nr:DNA repair protein RecO [Clostridia bacterium]